MSRRATIAAFLTLLLLAAFLRGLYPTADPPWRGTVGVVWHDEGAWTHNARNKALFGEWKTDQWNPLFIAPVFTGLEYLSFKAFGVGTWQARLVSQIAGTIAVLLLGLGVARLAGAAAGLAAAALLATNYVALMYDRAAIMEATVSAFIVCAWYAAVHARRAPVWGLLAALAAMLAFFTKATAAFFVAALAIDSLWTLIQPAETDRMQLRHLAAPSTWRLTAREGDDRDRTRAAAAWTLLGLVLAITLALACFVIPFWTEYRFYNWQMSVTRKPSYTAKALLDRLTWVPILHDIFSRMWIVWALALLAWAGNVLAGLRLAASERLLTLWLTLGLLELILHDVGNERRFVILIPALTALAAIRLLRDRSLLPTSLHAPLRTPTTSSSTDTTAVTNVPNVPNVTDLPDATGVTSSPWTRLRWIATLPFLLYVTYLIVGPLARLPFLYEVRPAVRLSAAIAIALLAAAVRLRHSLDRPWPFSPWLLVGAAFTFNLWQFWLFASAPTFKNYEASRALGRILPPGTLVHGKLANGLALENQIRPIFVGRNFGNYEDRLERNDVPLLLTYIAPKLGYEGPVILDLLEAYPHYRILRTFPVAESTGGQDLAALIEKGPPAVQAEPLLDTTPASNGRVPPAAW